MKNVLIGAGVILLFLAWRQRLGAAIAPSLLSSGASSPGIPYGGGSALILGDEIPFQGSGFGGGGSGIAPPVGSASGSGFSGSGSIVSAPGGGSRSFLGGKGIRPG